MTAVAIVGATASGKTRLALSLAAARPGTELVSVDAMAVYRGLDIGTAKPTSAQRAAVRWHLIDLVAPSEEFSVARFQALAREVLAEIAGRAGRALLVGGTGLYHRAVIDDLELPGQYPELHASLEARAEGSEGLAALYAELAERDPLAASRIEESNRRRIVRALEVTLGGGRPFSSYGPGLERYGRAPVALVGLRLDRAELDRRIAARLDAMLTGGLLEEVARLAPGAEAWSRTARQAIGYRELLAHLSGEISLEAARAEMLRRTRAFARRQEAWFRRDPRVTWFDASRDDLPGLVMAHLETGAGNETGT